MTFPGQERICRFLHYQRILRWDLIGLSSESLISWYSTIDLPSVKSEHEVTSEASHRVGSFLPTDIKHIFCKISTPWSRVWYTLKVKQKHDSKLTNISELADIPWLFFPWHHLISQGRESAKAQNNKNYGKTYTTILPSAHSHNFCLYFRGENLPTLRRRFRRRATASLEYSGKF